MEMDIFIPFSNLTVHDYQSPHNSQLLNETRQSPMITLLGELREIGLVRKQQDDKESPLSNRVVEGLLIKMEFEHLSVFVFVVESGERLEVLDLVDLLLQLLL